jgi:hypothetical protein
MNTRISLSTLSLAGTLAATCLLHNPSPGFSREFGRWAPGVSSFLFCFRFFLVFVLCFVFFRVFGVEQGSGGRLLGSQRRGACGLRVEPERFRSAALQSGSWGVGEGSAPRVFAFSLIFHSSLGGRFGGRGETPRGWAGHELRPPNAWCAKL